MCADTLHLFTLKREERTMVPGFSLPPPTTLPSLSVLWPGQITGQRFLLLPAFPGLFRGRLITLALKQANMA